MQFTNALTNVGFYSSIRYKLIFTWFLPKIYHLFTNPKLCEITK